MGNFPSNRYNVKLRKYLSLKSSFEMEDISETFFTALSLYRTFFLLNSKAEIFLPKAT